MTNDTGPSACRLDPQGTVSHLIYVTSQWDGDSIEEPALRSSKMPSSTDLTRGGSFSTRSPGEYLGYSLEDRHWENLPALLKSCPGGMMFISTVTGWLAGQMSLTEKPRDR